LEQAIDHRFQDEELLIRALTHSSYVHETHHNPVEPGELAQLSNEQFEFLGDAILGFVISEELVRRFPTYGEGKLSRLKAHLVSASHLCEAATRLELGRYLRLGRGEELSGGRDKRTLITDAIEALIAARAATVAGMAFGFCAFDRRRLIGGLLTGRRQFGRRS